MKRYDAILKKKNGIIVCVDKNSLSALLSVAAVEQFSWCL